MASAGWDGTVQADEAMKCGGAGAGREESTILERANVAFELSEAVFPPSLGGGGGVPCASAPSRAGVQGIIFRVGRMALFFSCSRKGKHGPPSHDRLFWPSFRLLSKYKMSGHHWVLADVEGHGPDGGLCQDVGACPKPLSTSLPITRRDAEYCCARRPRAIRVLRGGKTVYQKKHSKKKKNGRTSTVRCNAKTGLPLGFEVRKLGRN